MGCCTPPLKLLCELMDLPLTGGVVLLRWLSCPWLE